MKYGYKKQIRASFDEVLKKTKEELEKEGFGVLTEIDVKATFKKKLGIDYDNYVILGACNPLFAYKALEAEIDIGLLLPCNVIVYENMGKIVVASILPSVAMKEVENLSLNTIAKDVEDKLKKVVDETVKNLKK